MARFCERLKDLRESRGIAQQQLADALNVSRSTIGNYELGNREPNFEVLEEFADYFNVDMDYLIGKSDIERKVPISSADHIVKVGNDYAILETQNAIKISDEAKDVAMRYDNLPPEVRQMIQIALKYSEHNS